MLTGKNYSPSLRSGCILVHTLCELNYSPNLLGMQALLKQSEALLTALRHSILPPRQARGKLQLAQIYKHDICLHLDF